VAQEETKCVARFTERLNICDGQIEFDEVFTEIIKIKRDIEKRNVFTKSPCVK